MDEVSGYFMNWLFLKQMLVFHHIQCGLPQTEEFILYTGDGLTSTQEPHVTCIYLSVSPSFRGMVSSAFPIHVGE